MEKNPWLPSQWNKINDYGVVMREPLDQAPETIIPVVITD